MKQNKLLIAIAFGAVILFVVVVVFQNKENTNISNKISSESNTTNNSNDKNINEVNSSDYVVAHDQIANLPIENLSLEEKDGLLQMREEEKLAHDVYIALYEKWGVSAFSNIAKSELTHTESIRYLLERYNIEDPVKDNAVGVFSNKTFSDLYINLVTKGQESLVSALMVGATIEDLDIKDLNDLAKKVDNQDVLEIYDNLNRGSRNHLRSFSKQLEKQGVSYSAQYLSQEEINIILSANQEKGR
jgi:hypothetical protein